MSINLIANSNDSLEGVSYFGRLDYVDSSDFINFENFVLRPAEIAFSAVTTWDSWGLWNIDAVAEFQGAVFKTKDATCRQGVGAPQPCCIEFTLLKAKKASLYVEGFWSESGNEYKFTGNLRKR
jgi:hypothetical protein